MEVQSKNTRWIIAVIIFVYVFLIIHSYINSYSPILFWLLCTFVTVWVIIIYSIVYIHFKLSPNKTDKDKEIRRAKNQEFVTIAITKILCLFALTVYVWGMQ